MLTRNEIEDNFELHFRQQVEDLPDDELRVMLTDLRTLRKYAAPSLAASYARDIVSEVLDRRHPAPPPPPPAEVEPEPLPLPEVPPVDEAEGAAIAPLPAEEATAPGSETSAGEDVFAPAESDAVGTAPWRRLAQHPKALAIGAAALVIAAYLLLR